MRAITPHRPTLKASRWLIGATFFTLLIASAPAAADKVSGLAERLSSLRGEVEDLSTRLASQDAEIRDRLKALSRQKTELELELKREQTRIQKVHLSIKERRDKVAEEQGQDAELVPLFKESLEDVRGYVRGSLPFRAEERLAELDKLESQQKGGVLSASKAISRLWTFIEDEFRLTRESGLYKQPIKVEGKEHLAEVIRIGMVLLYFRVDDHFVGQAKRVDGKWQFETINDADQRKLTLDLFTSFKKQIRVGLFRVPATLPPPVESTIKAAPAKEVAQQEKAEADKKPTKGEEARIGDKATHGEEKAATKTPKPPIEGAGTSSAADNIATKPVAAQPEETK